MSGAPPAVAAIGMVGSALAVLSGVYLMPPPHLKCAAKTSYFGRFTYLTYQSNMLCALYYALRCVAPDTYVATHGWPLAFALGAGLTVSYYGLDHFVEAKRRDDREWRDMGWRWIPLANHLEHGMALPIALYQAARGGHAGESGADDVLWFCGGYSAWYLLFTLLNRRLTGVWVYPIFDEVGARVGGAAAFWIVALPVAAVYLSLGALGVQLAGGGGAV